MANAQFMLACEHRTYLRVEAGFECHPWLLKVFKDRESCSISCIWIVHQFWEPQQPLVVSLSVDFFHSSLFMGKHAAHAIRTKHRREERIAFLRLVAISVGNVFFNQLVLPMGKFTFFPIVAFAKLYPVLAHLRLVLCVIGHGFLLVFNGRVQDKAIILVISGIWACFVVIGALRQDHRGSIGKGERGGWKRSIRERSHRRKGEMTVEFMTHLRILERFWAWEGDGRVRKIVVGVCAVIEDGFLDFIRHLYEREGL